ncbi:MAG: GNAT family N-acetyltransferase [Dehalococcoidales bacterium]|jgi:CelD/BcsL family acetyltransferase involved in cellulose biosynthesis
MSYTVTENSLADLEAFRKDTRQNLDWPSVFVLPEWMQVWWQVFGEGRKMLLRTVRDGDAVIGIAPLLHRDGVAAFIGGTDVCDYNDFITAPGREQDFFSALLDYLRSGGITGLDLKHVRPDSAVMTSLVNIAEGRGYPVTSAKEEVSLEMELPSTFEAYLEKLDTKQRHEVRRKMRRLTEEGTIAYRFISRGDEMKPAVDAFFRMFVESRQDKADFLTEQMKSFFNLLVAKMAENGLLRLGVLELDGKPVAEIMCFDYNDCIYLYNSGYDPGYVSLSAGLLSKVFAIKDSIEQGKKKFDFLKGAEIYKYRLGGQEVPLFHCRINIQ